MYRRLFLSLLLAAWIPLAAAKAIPKPGAKDRYPWDIARDVGFLAMAGYLIVWPRTKVAVDNLLFRRTPERILDGQEVH